MATKYGDQGYGSSTYNGAVQGASTASVSQGGGGVGALSNTGIEIAAVVALASLIVLVAMVIRVWKRPAKSRL